MRHVYMRVILALIWVAAAIVSGMSGNVEMSGLYVLLGGLSLFSACSAWKKEKNGKGDK